MNQVIHGDCLETLKTLEDNSIDSIVTDPPYGLSFMGKKWDYDVPNTEIWQECLRVLKPGGYLLAFAGTRTQHRMAVRIEDAGFEIRDMIAWVYASGFPKSLNIGKAVDKLQGNEREELGDMKPAGFKTAASGYTDTKAWSGKVSKGTSEWEGWGTALKPALEPITVARKPIQGTVAENCLKWGVGGINIDESRVGYQNTGEADFNRKRSGKGSMVFMQGENRNEIAISDIGRFPANLIHDGSEEVVELFPNTKSGKMKQHIEGGTFNVFSRQYPRDVETIGDSGSAARFFYCAKASKKERNKGLDGTLTVKYNECISNNKNLCKEENMVAVQLLRKVISEQELVSFSTGESGESIMVQCQSGSLSTILTETRRIIGLKIYSSLMLSLTSEYTQDANSEMESGGSLAENVADLRRWILTTTNGQMELALGASRVALRMLSMISEEENWKPATNFHSTVKPIALMEYLVKLVSREGATVLDPFAGSGTTGIACKNLNRQFIGIEREEEYVKIANARMANSL